MNRIEIADFSRGLNTYDAAHAIGTEQSPDLQNMDVSRKGRCYTRNGHIRYSPEDTAGNWITGACYFKKTNKHVFSTGTFLYKWLPSTITTLLSNRTSNSQHHFAPWNGKLWIVNGAEDPIYFDGVSTFASPATPATAWAAVKPNYICEHENRLWTLTQSTSHLHWCALDDAEDWTAADNAGNHQFNPNDGWGCTGIVSQKSGLVVFKNYSIYKVIGKTPVSFSFPNYYNNIGCVAPRSIVNIENRIFFLSRNKGKYGVYILDDSGGLTLISKDITPTLEKMINNAPEFAAAIAYEDKYILSYPVDGGYKTVNYNYLTDSWESGYGDPCSVYYETEDTLYGGSWNGAFLLKMLHTANDAGNTIVSYIKTKNYLLEGADFTKKLKYLIVWAKASGAWELKIDIYVDDKLQEMQLKMPLGPRYSGEKTRREVIPINADIQGNMIAIKFGTNTVDQPFELYRAQLYYEILAPEIR